MNNSFKRAFSCVMVLLFLFSAAPLCAVSAVGDGAASRRVRVGWYNSDHFQEGTGETAQKSGYAYEYLQRVSNYTGWEYEYVDGGWAELYDAFLKGDVDLLAGVSYTEERAGLMNYPGYEMGFESYYIYKKAGNEDISGSDLSTLKGKRVGTLTNNLMTDFFESWMEETGTDCVEILFDDFQTRDEAFDAGEIDALIAVNNNVPSNAGYSPAVKVGESSYYLAVTRGRADLLAQLNQALAAINESNPYFTQSLQIKYFQNTAVNAALSPEESAWVASHDSISVGYLSDYLPYCGLNADGTVSGVITDIFREWQNQLGLSGQIRIEYVPYERYADLISALRAGEIDAAFPVHDNIWVSERQGIVQTNDLIESSIHMVYHGEYSEKTTRVIALSDRSPFQRNYAETHYPDSEIYLADSPEECLKAVKTGRATCAFFGSGRTDGLLAWRKYNMLNHVTLDETINYCIGVRKGNNTMYSLLERGISLIDKSNMTNAMYRYASSDSRYTASEFIQDNALVVLAVALLIIGLIVVVALMLAVNLRKAREQQEKEQKMLDLVTRQKEDLVTAKERLQGALERAEQASRSKSAFLSNMSHDIRTPMNAIIGFTNLARQSADDPDKTRDYLTKIQTSSAHLLALINDVLEMSRIESGKIELDDGPCNLPELAKGLYTMTAPLAEEKRQTLSLNLSGMADEDVVCDKLRLEQVLLNLLSNAVKYTPDGGAIELRIAQSGRGEDGRGHYSFHVRDNGIGMTPEFAARVFDAFEREKTSTVSGIQGTGLGMAITKRIVDLMGGTIDVITTPGAGSEFVVRVDYALAPKDAHRQGAERDETAEDAFSGKRLLLVDDMAINREIASAVLEMNGFLVEEADDGTKAVELVKNSEPGYYAAVLMDIQMPVMNGYEAARAIRKLEQPQLSKIPIIAMTANAFEEDRKAAFDAGMNGHVPKPIDVDALMETLRTVLDS